MRQAPPAFTVALFALLVAGCLDAPSTPAAFLEPDAPPIPRGSHAAYGFDVYLAPGSQPTHDRGFPTQRALPDRIRGLKSEAIVTGVTQGLGIAVFGNYAFAGGYSGPTNIIDVSNPLQARKVGEVAVPARDIDTIAYPDGRLVIVTTGGGRQMFSADVTRPESAQMLAYWDSPHGSHNLAVVPGTPIVYNSPSQGKKTDIYDLSNPEQPKLVNDWENGHGCHDIMFYNDPASGKFRAYCAGLDVTQIWDTADPVNPKIIAEMPFPPNNDPQGVISHMAMPNVDASVLVVGDETTGRCDLENLADGTPLETVVPKHTNIWFYDIRDEKAPTVHGKVTPELEYRACMNHFGRLIADREQIVISYYGDGILVVDFADIDRPYIVTKHPVAGSAWDAWYYQGYVFTGGGNGGMEVLTFT